MTVKILEAFPEPIREKATPEAAAQVSFSRESRGVRHTRRQEAIKAIKEWAAPFSRSSCFPR